MVIFINILVAFLALVTFVGMTAETEKTGKICSTCCFGICMAFLLIFNIIGGVI